MSKRVNFLFGFFSLFGLIGLNYFSNHDPSYLSYFAFFAFLANFFVARIDTSVLDERYYEDVRAEIEHGVTLSSAFDMYYNKYKIVGDRILISFI